MEEPATGAVDRGVRQSPGADPDPQVHEEGRDLPRELIEAGHYRAVIDRTYPLEQVIAATTYVESQQKTGNVVLTVIPATAN